MMTSTFKVVIPSHFKLATRPNGVEARTYVLTVLQDHAAVELDFQGATPTPSFADECIGVLCRTMGWDEFKKRVRLTNVPEGSRPLIKHVVHKRRAEAVAAIS
ncbi:STAS-like domain-containing protein [Ralstonia mannitolilytica]|uniref:STAS-like domain-containing protein n=1 Tax=Ralstonia mannitolilytica TaxID=105219 RepID=UPI0028F64F28|nr:hypothetical protein R76696_02038 [Ralstonia mannitolilytica]